ncbi:MAG: gluconokinase [Ktedonobacterales bacterium]
MSADLKLCTIGLDIGTTTIKALAFDSGATAATGGLPVGSSSTEVSTMLQDEKAEQDPNLVYSLSIQVLAETTRAVTGIGYTVGRVGISAAMHSILAISNENVPLTNAMLWIDGRAQSEAEALWSTPAGPRLYARTGTPIHSMSPLAKLLWLRQRLPEIWQQSAKFVSLKEWIWHHWFGVWEVDISVASATGLYQLQTETWDEEALQLLGLAPSHLSTLVPTTFTRTGLVEPGLISAGLTDGTPITIGASDGVLANLGMHAIDPKALVLTIGTSCAVRRGSDLPYTNPASRSFCSVLDHDRFIIGAASNSGGVVLNWLGHMLGSNAATPAEEEAFWLRLLEAASRVSSEGLIVLPYVAGERAPLWDADASGLISGLRLHHQPEHLVRAAVEGILLNAYWMSEDLLARAPRPESLLTTGGVLTETWIAQLASEIFQLPVFEGSHIDASARGAALLADIAAGEANWPGAFLPGHPVAVPSSDVDYRQEYRRFRQISAQVTGR